MTKVELLKILNYMNACSEALEWICRTNGNAESIYNQCDSAEWLVWLYLELDLKNMDVLEFITKRLEIEKSLSYGTNKEYVQTYREYRASYETLNRDFMRNNYVEWMIIEYELTYLAYA